jgi:outer membrane protein assembly factor BamB
MMPLVSLLLGLLVGASDAAQARSWPQWGGPSRNFMAPATDLAQTWPASGPRQLWRRALGDGFSGIVTDGTLLYTLYRDGADDVAVALRAEDGKTQWEARYPAPFNETCSERLGPVPRAAPLLAGDLLITTSAGGSMQSFDRRTGKPGWRIELIPPGSEAAKPCGYSSSPVQFGEVIITMAGGKGRGIVAVDAASGRIRWSVEDFMNGYSSPLIIDVAGRPELIAFTAAEVSGFDPRTGARDWSIPHPADYGVNVAMPLWTGDGLLFVSSAYNGGSRVLRLSRAGEKVNVEEVWAHKRVRIHFGNGVRLGNRLYMSSGDTGSAPFAAVDVNTGDILWRDRTVARASLIAAGGRLIILDENGLLVLAEPKDDGLRVLAQAQIFNGRAWTAPSLSGTRLYLRDRKEVVAVELGR